MAKGDPLVRQRMLELGCGDNPRPERGFRYWGVDNAEGFVPACQRKLADQGFEVYTHTDFVPEMREERYPNIVHFFNGCNLADGHSLRNLFPLNWFDRVLADQVLEHIPRVAQKTWGNKPQAETFNPVIALLNQIWLVCKSNAYVQFNVPKWNSAEMWQDPTHVNPVPPQFWKYWDPADEWNLKKSYGINASFRLDEVVDCGWYHIFRLTTIKKPEQERFWHNRE
jgi:hypothetical protein